MSTTGTVPSEPTSAPQPAGLPIRLAAAAYEAVLLFGVVFVADYALVASMRWTYPLSGFQNAILRLALFLVLGAYFVYQWTRTGQPLAMKSWHLRLVARNGLPPTRAQAALRYVLAWHLL